MLRNIGHHVNGTISAYNMNFLCGPDGLTTARADIFPGTAGFLWLRLLAAHATRTDDCKFVPPVLGRTERLERRGRLGHRPSDFRIIVNTQAPFLSLLLKAFVMISIASAGVLDTVQVTPVMNHIMHQRCYDTGYGAV